MGSIITTISVTIILFFAFLGMCFLVGAYKGDVVLVETVEEAQASYGPKRWEINLWKNAAGTCRDTCGNSECVTGFLDNHLRDVRLCSDVEAELCLCVFWLGREE